MQTIHIKERIILIVGPSSVGKTTLSKKLKEESLQKSTIISHDDVLSTIRKDQPQSTIDFQFRTKLLSEIESAISDKSNKYIILDTLNISKVSLWAFLNLISLIPNSNSNGLLLLKLNISQSKNLEYAKKHYPEEKQAVTYVMEQRKYYESPNGSLHSIYPRLVTAEYVIDPANIQFVFD